MIEEQQKQEIVKALKIFISMMKDIAQGGESKRKGIMKFFHNKAVVKGNSFGIGEVEIREITDNQTNKLKELIKGEDGIQSSINQLPDKVVEVIKTSFEKELSNIGATYTKTEEIQKALNKFINEKIPDFMEDIEEKIGASFDAIIKELKAGNTEINRRLDLYMTSTEKTIAENTAQLKNVEKMLQLKEEKDRKNFDAIKKGIEGLAEGSQDIKDKIGGLLKEETAFQEFQTLRDQNKEIKEILNGMCEYLKNQDTVLQDKISTASDEQITEIKEAIAKSDAKLLGMIMPEIANLKGKNDQILINQDTQTTILNSILSGQRDDALQYVAMSEKLDNLTELVSALGTKTNEQSFAENANKLLENFATSQEAMFAAAFEKIAKKDDLKHLDTGIDSIIEKLHDDSVKFDEVCAVVENMANQIDSIARTGENNSKKLDDIHKILLSSRVALDNVADCDRCHSAKSMFYKCQICGYNGESTNIATPNTGQNQYKREIQWWNEDRKILTPILSKIHVRNAAGESEIKYFIYISDVDASNRSNKIINAGMKYNNNDVETIIFEACDLRNSGKVLDCQTKEGCNIEEIFIELNRPLSGYDKNNIWEYFPNLKTISFAKPMDDKRKYVLGTGLLYIDNVEDKIDAKGKVEFGSKTILLDKMNFYGGKYIAGMENSVCYLEEKDGKTFLDVILDKTKDLHKIISNNSDAKGGTGYWRQKIKSANKEEK